MVSCLRSLTLNDVVDPPGRAAAAPCFCFQKGRSVHVMPSREQERREGSKYQLNIGITKLENRSLFSPVDSWERKVHSQSRGSSSLWCQIFGDWSSCTGVRSSWISWCTVEWEWVRPSQTPNTKRLRVMWVWVEIPTHFKTEAGVRWCSSSFQNWLSNSFSLYLWEAIRHTAPHDHLIDKVILEVMKTDISKISWDASVSCTEGAATPEFTHVK